jgi:hypothetical protein
MSLNREHIEEATGSCKLIFPARKAFTALDFCFYFVLFWAAVQKYETLQFNFALFIMRSGFVKVDGKLRFTLYAPASGQGRQLAVCVYPAMGLLTPRKFRLASVIPQ